jgi:cytochrome c
VRKFGQRAKIDGSRHFIPLFVLLLTIALISSACSESPTVSAADSAFPGDPERGVQAFVDYGCISCHTIPGVPRARGIVGPPLNSWADRSFIAGQFPNSEENLTSWLMAPQAMIPGSAMPDLGVTWQDALDMSAYLFSLSGNR